MAGLNTITTSAAAPLDASQCSDVVSSPARTAGVNRRNAIMNVLAATAAVTTATAIGTVSATACADAKLFALQAELRDAFADLVIAIAKCEELSRAAEEAASEEVARELRRQSDAATEEAIDRMSEVTWEISKTPAETIEGLAIKAAGALAFFWTEDVEHPDLLDADEPHDATQNAERTLWVLARNIMALSRKNTALQG